MNWYKTNDNLITKGYVNINYRLAFELVLFVCKKKRALFTKVIGFKRRLDNNLLLICIYEIYNNYIFNFK